MHRILVPMVIAFAFVACGSSGSAKQPSEHQAAVEQYLNQDMNALIGMLWVGKRPLMTIKASHFEEANGWFKPPGALDKIVIPRMTDFIDGATKITPPGPLEAAHRIILEIATTWREVAGEMIAAVEANEPAKFAAAHARLMEASERYAIWQANLDKVLDTHGVTLKDPPPPPPYPAQP